MSLSSFHTDSAYELLSGSNQIAVDSLMASLESEYGNDDYNDEGLFVFFYSLITLVEKSFSLAFALTVGSFKLVSKAVDLLTK